MSRLLLIILIITLLVLFVMYLVKNYKEPTAYHPDLIKLEEAKSAIDQRLKEHFNSHGTISYDKLLDIVNSTSFILNLIILIKDGGDFYSINIIDEDEQIEFGISKSVVTK